MKAMQDYVAEGLASLWAIGHERTVGGKHFYLPYIKREIFIALFLI